MKKSDDLRMTIYGLTLSEAEVLRMMIYDFHSDVIRKDK